MVPWPSPTNADRWNLQPLYARVNRAVRAVNEDVLAAVSSDWVGGWLAGWVPQKG